MKNLTLFLILTSTICFGQLQKFSFEQIDSLTKTTQKPTIVFIHTDWCKFCFMMQNTTLKNDSIIETINSNFYYTELNAESTESIEFNDSTYLGAIGNTPHLLALELGNVNGQLSYPTLCILNNDLQIIGCFNQYIDHKTLLKTLKQALKTRPYQRN